MFRDVFWMSGIVYSFKNTYGGVDKKNINIYITFKYVFYVHNFEALLHFVFVRLFNNNNKKKT